MRTLVIASTILTACLVGGHAQQLPRRFPSALAGFAIVGNWQAPTDPDTINEFMAMYGSATAADVKRWELQHSDFIAGGEQLTAADAAQHVVLGYEYIHTNRLSMDREISEDDLKIKWAIQRGKNPEDFSLHFKQDTVVNTLRIGTVDSFWMGRLSAGVTDSATHSGVWLSNAGGDAFRGVPNGGALYVWSSFRFMEIRVDLSQAGVGGSSLVIEYPSAVGTNWRATEWRPVTILSDGTNVFSQSGVIRIAPPSDWKYGRPEYASFTHAYLGNNGGAYFVRIRASGFTTRPLISRVTTMPAMEYVDAEPYLGVVHQGTAQGGGSNTITLSDSASATDNAYRDHLVKIVAGTGAGQVRVISSYVGATRVATVDTGWDTIPDNTSQYKVVRRAVLIRGWDPANDRNSDGWVDDTEFANLANPNATARMRHLSRVIFINAWSSSGTWDLANVFNPDYRQATAEVIRDRWVADGRVGCYIDDAVSNGLGRMWVMRSGAGSPAVLQGGYLWEYSGGRVDEDNPTGDAWFDGYIATIQKLREVTGSNWIGANISNVNPFVDYYASRLPGVLDWFDCEDTIRFTSNIDAWGGLCLRPGWIYPAIAARGSLSFIYAHHTNYNAMGIPNTRETWEYYTRCMLATFYMINVPNRMAILFWNHSYTYGSSNTSTSTYWKAGVPKNYAYQPTKMLQFDIGVPANTIPEGKRPMDLAWQVTGGGLTKIGDTTSTQLTLPDGTVVPTTPTYIYILHQIDSRQYRGGNGLSIPYDAVYARNYTNGLILSRLKITIANIPNYGTNTVTVPLPGVFRVLNYDGTLGPPVTEVSIRGGEGIILVPDSQSSTPNVQLTITADKTNPKPLDVVTVTITATNAGNAEARNVRITHNIPQGATYVLGSLKLNGNALPDPTDTTKIEVTVASIPVGGRAVVEYLMVVR